MVPGSLGCGSVVFAAMATLAPSRAARRPIASPIPREAPVMNSVLPFSDICPPCPVPWMRPSRRSACERLQAFCLELAIAALRVGDVVAHDRRGVAPARELHVEHELAAGAEHHLGRDQVELPHAAEALV